MLHPLYGLCCRVRGVFDGDGADVLHLWLVASEQEEKPGAQD